MTVVTLFLLVSAQTLRQYILLFLKYFPLHKFLLTKIQTIFNDYFLTGLIKKYLFDAVRLVQ